MSVGSELTLLSPGKINAFFRVLKKREDGFHEIVSLYQAISLFDIVLIRKSDKDTLICSDPRIPVDERNLARKALALFRKKTGISDRFFIRLEKKIPVEAGLGGGSSNAATVLWGLNKVTDFGADPSLLQSWGAELGSDVPFFFSSGSALARGRGEILSEAEPLISEPLTIVKPRSGLSTPAVYRAVRIRSEPERPILLYNDLEEAAFSLLPELAELKSALIDLGFSSVVLSGSGTAFFCLGKVPKANLSEAFPDLQMFFVRPLLRKSGGWYEGENHEREESDETIS